MSIRDERLKEVIAGAGIDALLITKPANQRYLEGFTGAECYMLASGAGNLLIADSRYTELAGRECRNAKILPHRAPHPDAGDVIAGAAKQRGFRRIGFESENITWGEYDDIAGRLAVSGVEFVPTRSLVEGIRAKKAPEEAAMIGSACQIADRALKDLFQFIKPGISELDLKIELEYRLKTGGAEDVGFDSIVLFGARASQPHATSQGDVYLRNGDFVLIDYGASKGGYRSDTTRTFVCGRAAEEQRAAYETVLRSQVEALAMVAPGTNCRDINSKAVGIIKDAGFPVFDYGIGHGVGLEIHELPSMRQNADVILEAGQVVTIEPGIYKPGWGGIRIEDTVLVTESGHSVLTFFPKELIEL